MDDKIEECDNVTALELQKSKRILHFSDGILEEFSDSDEETVDATDMEIDVKSWPLVPRIKYQVYQAGCKFLNGIDYVGGGLANFLGITTPKFVSESDIKAVYEGNRKIDEDNENVTAWNQNNNNTPNMVVTRCPQSSMSQVSAS
ncbi:protein FAM177A1 [Stomoxys calcitrans]|uniref:Uncharacterized protein n=1 Tax=Stomoxys calcitrans TaxID=35570 RepID=A0A1I8NYA4_STOCA|nr:protein FAM177A1 [Stomoxys calcitrans]